MSGRTTPGLDTGFRIDYGHGFHAVTVEQFADEWHRIGNLHRDLEATARATTARPVERARAPRGGRRVTTRAGSRGPPSGDEPHEHDLARRALIGGAA